MIPKTKYPYLAQEFCPVCGQWNLYENNLLSERHIHYGGYGGVAYYHVSETYIALFSHFIACGAWEVIYILDGLTKNKSDIQPDI